MHTCPDCGQACYCHGDIDDHETGEDDLCEHYHECGSDDLFDDGEEDGFGCCYPGECVMPGLHMRSECHTAADYERSHGAGGRKPETPNAELSGPEAALSPEGRARTTG